MLLLGTGRTGSRTRRVYQVLCNRIVQTFCNEGVLFPSCRPDRCDSPLHGVLECKLVEALLFPMWSTASAFLMVRCKAWNRSATFPFTYLAHLEPNLGSTEHGAVMTSVVRLTHSFGLGVSQLWTPVQLRTSMQTLKCLKFPLSLTLHFLAHHFKVESGKVSHCFKSFATMASLDRLVVPNTVFFWIFASQTSKLGSFCSFCPNNILQEEQAGIPLFIVSRWSGFPSRSTCE